MEWLHISDFHAKSQPGTQQQALSNLVDCLQDSFKTYPGKIDALFLAGDLAFSGKKDEYDRFHLDFLEPILNLQEVVGCKVFAVPGNHDVDCDSGAPITWGGLRKRHKDIFFEENENGFNIRQSRVDVFKRYVEYVNEKGIISPNPYQEVSKNVVDSDLPFNLVLTNTSFFCDREDDSSRPITPAPTTSIRSCLSKVDKGKVTIIVGHHPRNSFLPEHQKQFDTLLVDSNAIYLHGHEHLPQTTFNSDGSIRTLGFGAAYQASLSDAADGAYRNCFARCKFNEVIKIRAYAWEPAIGRWQDSTRSQFSDCFQAHDDSTDMVNLTLPGSKSQGLNASTTEILKDIPRQIPVPGSVSLLSAPSSNSWRLLISACSSIPVSDAEASPPTNKDGKLEFNIILKDRRGLMVCIPGSSHIMSKKEVETYNTRLDTEDLDFIAIASLGKLSADGRLLYQRLKTRKNIEIVANNEIAGNWQNLLSIPQAEYLTGLDAGSESTVILVHGNEIHLLVYRAAPNSIFWIIGPNGQPLQSSHEAVARVRRDQRFAQMPYMGDIGTADVSVYANSFDLDSYLVQCYKESNTMKYAALSNIGIRYPEMSLDRIYIDASASEVDVNESNRLDDLVEDHLAAFPLSDKLKDHIKKQLLSETASKSTNESSQMREFCQKYGAILITGDPGSGKTCFVKSEILEYAKRSLPDSDVTVESDEWHSLHVPILIQLSQVASEKDLKEEGILKITARLLARRGINFPYKDMDAFLNEGRLAIFFDGLDEVVSVEKRAIVVQEINDLVSRSLDYGNRFVVTSRPAAVNVVNLLPSLHQLELQGLNEDEISNLAKRILSLEVSSANDGAIVENAETTRQEDSPIIGQILDDCRTKPGVARLAKNPLLLTLLVMIYANSGAPAAKRHRIYEEAVKTLASVRGYQAGHARISVQDLRERLGVIALSVFKKESGILPTRGEVNELVRNVMSRQKGGAQVDVLAADAFLQKVAESTGLIAIGGESGAADDSSVVTFMHHSFMEYFAANALSRDLESVDIRSLVTQPRWVEILTLLAGIIGEKEDVAPVLSRFIGDGSDFGPVEAKYLLFAFDCAIECDVPSDSAIDLLISSLEMCLTTGPGRSDPSVRSTLAQRVSQLTNSCGTEHFEELMVRLIKSDNPSISAAGISFTGHVCQTWTESQRIRDAIHEIATRTDTSIVCALCDASARVQWLRTDALLQVIGRALKGGHRSRISAFEAASSIPHCATNHWPDIVNGLDDSSLHVRKLSSKAAIAAGLNGDIAALSTTKKDIVAEAFRYASESYGDYETPSGDISKDTIEKLLSSSMLRDRVIGILLSPYVTSDTSYAHKIIIDVIASESDHRETTAALRALKTSKDALVLVTNEEFRHITKLAREGVSDVRIAAIHVIAQFSAESDAVSLLIEKAQASPANVSEFCAVMHALGRSEVLQDDIADLLGNEILERMSGSKKRSEGFCRETVSVLDAARDLGRNMEDSITSCLRVASTNYKENESVRNASITSYAAIAVPSKSVASTINTWISKPAANFEQNYALARTLRLFAINCRQSVDFVIACVESMAALQETAIAMHSKFASKRTMTFENEAIVSELRNGIREITQILDTFTEFIVYQKNN